ncbi:histidine kinase [Microbacterium sp. 10M-3C3]|jgi:hypothetical protein|uniref:histidine kinase n=1 Tax=Microbacterium sp. 10M-3C3 TaxID=2483401 RepID=UPI000F62E67C|nr:histidine kinase [Microbacterium sp. 10M-3C3]
MSIRIAAAVLLGLEALGVAVLLVEQIVAIATGDIASLSSALALAVLTLVGVAAVISFAIATARGRSWGRSGGIVVQALILAVAGGALVGEGANPAVAALLAVPALVCGALLFFSARREGGSGRDAA